MHMIFSFLYLISFSFSFHSQRKTEKENFYNTNISIIKNYLFCLYIYKHLELLLIKNYG